LHALVGRVPFWWEAPAPSTAVVLFFCMEFFFVCPVVWSTAAAPPLHASRPLAGGHTPCRTRCMPSASKMAWSERALCSVARRGRPRGRGGRRSPLQWRRRVTTPRVAGRRPPTRPARPTRRPPAAADRGGRRSTAAAAATRAWRRHPPAHPRPAPGGAYPPPGDRPPSRQPCRTRALLLGRQKGRESAHQSARIVWASPAHHHRGRWRFCRHPRLLDAAPICSTDLGNGPRRLGDFVSHVRRPPPRGGPQAGSRPRAGGAKRCSRARRQCRRPTAGRPALLGHGPPPRPSRLCSSETPRPVVSSGGAGRSGVRRSLGPAAAFAARHGRSRWVH